MPKRRYVILAEGAFANEQASKTARGVLRYSEDDVVAVVDSTLAGRDVADIAASIGRSAPIVARVSDTLALRPTSLLVGIAPVGGTLPAAFRSQVLAAIEAGLEIVNGLHDLLRDDEEFVACAARSGSRLWDVREPTGPLRVFTGEAYDVPQVVVLAVGSDCSVGKMSTMLELQAAARGGLLEAAFVATGQTGIMIAGSGIAVDRVIADYLCGAAEQLVLDIAPSVDVTLVEGQGGIFHPAYAPVTLGLLYGTAPDALILCHRAGQREIAEFGSPIPPLRALIAAHEALLAPIKSARCVAVALNTSHLGIGDARRAIDEIAAETGLPADDVVRFGGDRLWNAVAAAAAATPKGAKRKKIAALTV